MSCCEKCWSDAFLRFMSNPTKSQTEHYINLIDERAKNPCSLKEQAGEYWDEEKQRDGRLRDEQGD